MNGLKYTNDNYGYKAKDELLISFSEMLKKYFDLENIFRISGDEFVVILDNYSKENFDRIVDEFKIEVGSKREIASIDTAYGYSDNANNLMNEAEDLMYEDKERIHRNNPKLLKR